jgi:nitrate/TMAO reductase-like tetraheme cytochrome c subunit
LQKFNATTNPNHTAAKFSTDCKTCHTSVKWTPATFNHNTATTFQLSGGHIGVSCISCHSKGYAGIPTDCVSCHLTKFNATTVPNHLTAKYPTDCRICHSSTAWVPSPFNHTTGTTFPLTGAHATVACASCHTNGYTGGTPTDCAGCHLPKFNVTTNPNHTAAKFSTDCKTCHTSVKWTPATFNHNTATTFQLSGNHIGVSCISCHNKGYAGISSDCVSCHLTKFNATLTPNHITAKYPTDCKICHTSTGWIPSKFNHTTGTSFPLIGAHTTVACTSCHTNGYAGGTPTDCASCHLTKFNATTNPGHAAARFSTDCKACHTSTAWTPTSFNHNTSTTFPLSDGHIGVSCISCHTKGYTGISTDCVSCHLDKYNATTSPNHVVAKYTTDCKLCHTVTAWKNSTFNHNASEFPLTGAHSSVACATCHVNGYTGTSAACVSCHQTKYNATTNPSHTAAKFSTDCKACHTSTAWIPSTYDHNTSTNFTLTGSHIGISCISCHAKGYKGISADCVSCHLTNYNTTTTPNHVTLKYPTDCKICHASTVWTNATFNHTTGTVFPLTGAHSSVNCSSCHTNGYSGGTPTSCTSCHLTKYNATINPNHTTAKFSTDRPSCKSDMY